jgi:hypothetical protein
MTDFYQQAEDGLTAQLRTLTDLFPAGVGKAAGWQVSSSDTVISEGGEYFIIVRPGAFPVRRAAGKLIDVEWHCTVVFHQRFIQAEDAWADFKAARSEIFNKVNGDPTLNQTPFVWDVLMDSTEEPGYLQDSDGNSQNIIVQSFDVAITQRIPRATAIRS